jgi:hypothetical protein
MVDTGFSIKDRKRLAQPFANDPLTGKPQKIEVASTPVKFDCGGSCAFVQHRIIYVLAKCF